MSSGAQRKRSQNPKSAGVVQAEDTVDGTAALEAKKLPKPVLKWAGGKRQLLPAILSELPPSIGTYYEPFVGGAALFFALAAKRRFERAVLSDKNPELVGVYKALRDDAEKVIELLDRYRERHSEREYYKIRAARPGKAVERAARILYLNKTGYNGLYRVNSRGEFNVPFGRYRKPNICDTERLLAAAQALNGVLIETEDFEVICRRARPGDVVYLDPPYLPLSKTANFTAYHSDSFGHDEHERLARVFAKLAKNKVFALLSNSDTPFTRELYENFSIKTVRVARPINSNARLRGKVSEVLVRSLK